MKIFIGSDHAGFELKGKLISFLENLGYKVIDKGTFEYNSEDDYPDFVSYVAKEVSVDFENSKGIVLGGSGQGEAITANRFKGIRAVVFYGSVIAKQNVDVNGRKNDDPFEIIKLSREHNDANILSLGVRFISQDEAKKAIKLWLETPFSKDPRHIRRINKIG